ncbi:unnamed protein product [Acanthoscelides obtectus]|uniref:Uncharacterized protein n=1 Tax=Acanthoscelides obtectus TaxID=200917 RepID=A0A9P0P3T5_ACAOB|nr:unnamed protein product [Acanthoscelides obtectus]CAK1656011.1 hypothetical protein AOBTE_LOCUS19511 [Acanthoscelides obtectus]
MKSKIKNITDMKKIGNRKIKLNEWQKKFFNLWNGSENPVIQQVPGGVTAGTSQDVDISLTDEENQIPFCDDKELMAKLRKKLLLQQINTAAAQEKAAIAQEKAALAVERAAGAVEQFVEDYFARQQASF